MRRARQISAMWLALAVLALVARIVVPAGFMPAQTAGGVALVICTGHGPLAIDGPQDPKAPKPGSRSDAPCAFAAAPSAAPPPPVVTVLAEPYAISVDPGRRGPVADLIPGRGLAAPPPPSQGPPSALL
jgi:hypothetical protein